MNSVIIRKAQKNDCLQILNLIKELAVYEKAEEQVTVSLEHFQESGFGPRSVWWALVAEDKVNGNLVAFALYYIRYSTWKGQRLYLEDLYVKKSWRRNKVGTLLFEALIKEAKEQKLNGMVWQVLEWNKSAIQFYEKYQAELDPQWINASIAF